MQFVLEDTQARAFRVEIDRSPALKALVKKYGRHLGKESFYELMPNR
jgi:sulfur relay (sulfurtransferase) DsrC/TusE family protein